MPLTIGGLLAIGFYAAHATAHVFRGTPEGAIWACHVASLLIGAGLLSRSATLNAVGLLIVAVGLPNWLVNLAAGGPFMPTSPLTHVGGLLVGLFGARRLGLPRLAWFRSLIVVAALTAASIWWTPPASNINLAFHGPDFVVRMGVPAAVYLLGVLAFWGLCLWTAERLVGAWLRRARSKST